MQETGAVEIQPEPPRERAPGQDLAALTIAFALVFVIGFGIVAFVLMSRRKRQP